MLMLVVHGPHFREQGSSKEDRVTYIKHDMSKQKLRPSEKYRDRRGQRSKQSYVVIGNHGEFMKKMALH
jgi:hypothetical protein